MSEQSAATPQEAAVVRSTAIAGFAERLRTLRGQAGNPSFRELAGRSSAISHTTLHEAAQGHRLPSWSTVVEFVKACGGDPASFRPSWEAAEAAVRAAGTAAPLPVPASTPPAAGAEPPVAGTDPDPVVDGAAAPIPLLGTPPARRRRRVVAVAAVLVLAGAAATAVVLANRQDRAPAAAPGSGSAVEPSRLTAADCPIHTGNPPAAQPRHPGDRSAFLGDLTLQDCAEVAEDTTVTKIWRIQNVGTVTWRGYSLRRMEQDQTLDQCQTISAIVVPTTAPGGTVDVRVAITTPPHPTFCFGRFKMYDGDGQLAFGGSRPINFQLVVVDKH